MLKKHQPSELDPNMTAGIEKKGAEVIGQIQQKVGAIPNAAKILTEKQYEDQMSFVLHH